MSGKGSKPRPLSVDRKTYESNCVHIYANNRTKWWELNRWRQIWQILTKGYAEMQTTIVLKDQTAINYANTLTSAIKDVKIFRDNRKKVTNESKDRTL
jgi:hypothetical protein